MNKTTGIILGVIALIIVGGVYASKSNKNAEMMAKVETEEKGMGEKLMDEQKATEGEKMAADDLMMKKDGETNGEDMMQKKEEAPSAGAMMKKDEPVVMKEKTTEVDSMMKKDDSSMVQDGHAMMKAGSYETYTSEKVALASQTHDVVLFFRASWCPTCRSVDSDIKAKLSDIPSSLTILDVDYDKSTALKQKYGVTYQHTFVQVDADGKLIKKWSGSPTLSALVAEVQ